MSNNACRTAVPLCTAISTAKAEIYVDSCCGLRDQLFLGEFSLHRRWKAFAQTGPRIPASTNVDSTGRSPGCAQPGRRVCTVFPQLSPPPELERAVRHRQNVSGLQYN